MEKRPPANEQEPSLKFANLVPEVWLALGNLKRTGWVDSKVKNPESVQEHIITLMNLAVSLEGLSEQEKDGLLDMLEVHDWPEVIEGDQVILTHDQEEKQRLHADKFKREQEAMWKITRKLDEDTGDLIMALWLRFESSNDEAANLARQIDKYQAIEKALEYEKAQGIPLFKEFLDYEMMQRSITHPILLERIEMLKREFENK